ncbi:energy-coupling factor ABC transporter ATP-binding protein [Roseibium sp.]|uniref:energy-coupling factor ABC transporter ATP-binding protein n=1 Tax=Roseibium sp. TaxID=1936156 RepID=UPI003A9859B8
MSRAIAASLRPDNNCGFDIPWFSVNKLPNFADAQPGISKSMPFWIRKDKNRGAGPDFDPAADPYAHLKNVRLDMGGRAVLSDITLSLREDRIGIVGLNGSGKSSLVRLLNGLRQPASGTVRMFGADVTRISKDLPRYVGFVFQNPDHQAIFPTVEEEIAFGLTQLGYEKNPARGMALAFLEEHKCAHLAQKPFAELSEGQKQLICILAVLVMEPRLLVLDEPMSSLDGLAARKIMTKLGTLDQKVIMVSHDLALLTSFDRVIWMEEGRIRMDGPAKAVLKAYEDDLDRRAGTEQVEEVL